MLCYVGLGSNLGDRLLHLEKAARFFQVLRAAPVFETPALLPPGAPANWAKPFLNTVIEIEAPDSPQELLQKLKQVERELGREADPARWAPRTVDLDLLLFGDDLFRSENLTVPHPEMQRRNFVLTPLKHLIGGRKIPGTGKTVLEAARALPSDSGTGKNLPAWMEIVNLTPDSFSRSAGESVDLPVLLESPVHIIDIGAESTRPGAETVDLNEEWSRLKEALEICRPARVIRPWISLDTRKAAIAARAAEKGVDIINDVSAGGDPEMIDVIVSSRCQYVFMHHLTVPADASVTMPETVDPVMAVKNWAINKLDEFQKRGLDPSRLIFDPGIGFNKTPAQNLALLRRIDEFLDLPVRVLVGHSRKSFMKIWTDRPAAERDPETLGVSLALARKGVDILRVHRADLHQRAERAFQEVME